MVLSCIHYILNELYAMITSYYRFLGLIAAAFLLQSCFADRYDSGSSQLDPDNAFIAGSVVGESVSENQSGMVSTFSEAFAVPTESGLRPGVLDFPGASTAGTQNYTHSFNPETGEHTVQFTRTTQDVTNQTTEHQLVYIFYDISGGTISDPQAQASQIDAVEYRGSRNGEIENDIKQSFFTRNDVLFLTGLSDQTATLTIDGYHSGEGRYLSLQNGTQTAESEYTLDINYLDIQIDKEKVQASRNFRRGVYGALSYESVQRIDQGSGPQTQIINGTIDLNGDGTALLSFRQAFSDLRFRILDGDLFDDDEFEGRVTQVDLSNRLFTIANGQRIQINDDTVFDDGDFNSLEEVSAALQQNIRIIAEGDYFQPQEGENLWIATEVEFELEDNEFEDFVTQVNLSNSSFTLADGRTFYITESSDVDYEDGLASLQDVATAVQSGLPVEAEGTFSIDLATGLRMIKEVEFEIDLDSDNENVFSTFDEHVVSVNLSEQSFILTDGQTYFITEQTIYDEDSDYFSLEDLNDALLQGEEIEAEGIYTVDTETGQRIVIIIEFDD